MGDVVAQHLVEAQGARHAVDDAQHVGAEVRLQLGVLVQVVEHHARHGVTLEGDDDAEADAVGGLVVDTRDAGELAGGDLLSDVGDHVVRVDLVRQLGDDDGLAVARLLDRGDAAHADGATAGGVGVLDALVTDDETRGREIGALDVVHARLESLLLVGLRVAEQPVDRVGEFVEVVRRDVRRHTDRDTAGAVHEQVRHARRQDVRLAGLAVVVRGEVDGVLADVADHLHGQRRHLALGVTHGGRAVVAAGAEVTLAVDQRVAHVPRLGEAHQGVVDGDVAVGVELTHRVGDGAGGLHVAALRAVAGVEHRVHDAAVDGLHAVPDLRQRTTDDDGHRVVDVAGLHLLIDVDGEDAVEEVAATLRGVVAHGHLSVSGVEDPPILPFRPWRAV